jgi:hypothetical protein
MNERLLGLTDDDFEPLAPRAHVVRLALARDEDGLTLTLVLRSVEDAAMCEIAFTGVRELCFRDPDTTLVSSGRFLVADITRHGWDRIRYRVTEVEEGLVAFYCEDFDTTTLPEARPRRVADAREAVRSFDALQRSLVEAFLAHYQPVDREFFRGVAPGLFFVEGHEWEQRRHGAGVSFTHVQLGHVNAHVHLAARPGAIDAWRLYLYFESVGVAQVELDGTIYDVGHRPMRRLLDALEAEGMLRRVDLPSGDGSTLEIA